MSNATECPLCGKSARVDDLIECDSPFELELFQTKLCQIRDIILFPIFGFVGVVSLIWFFAFEVAKRV